ncbi:WG repeat-containing protein [Paenibacillus sp. GCM10027626]|uniref:WG repeat-containing protein n=1 Tax=Paenibacillus sp. GCM10027626 TaxID=3273411 RepID=UPI00363FEE32
MDDANWRLAQFVRIYLPAGAELVTIDRPRPHYAVLATDLNGDRHPEISAVYRMPNGQLYLLVLRMDGNNWSIAANMKGNGYGVTVMAAADITGDGMKELVVGWQIGANWSKLSIYKWSEHGLHDIAPEQTVFSYLDLVYHPSESGGRDTVGLAIWTHDTGEAYWIEIMRWQDGRLVLTEEFNQLYFPGVVQYYEKMVLYYPTYTFYWYHLALAQWKAGMPNEALRSIRHALSFEHPYPSREELLRLEREITGNMQRFMRAEELYPVPVKMVGGTRYGYINRQGQMTLEPQFEEAGEFQPNGLAAVRINGRVGLIDKTGQFVVQPSFQYIGPFSEQRAVVIKDNKFYLMDTAGHLLNSQGYGFIGNLHEGRAVFYTQAASGELKYGYLDADGRPVIPAIYSAVNDFDHGKAVVKIKDNHFAIIDLNGNRLSDILKAFVGPIGDGLLSYQESPDGKFGYLDEKGRTVIEPAFTFAQTFQDGRAVVSVSTSADGPLHDGLIDKRGKYVIDPVYNQIRQLGEGRLALGRAINESQPYIGSLFAIADMDGKRLSSFMFNEVDDYHDGLASVSDMNQTYFIDRSGQPAAGYPKLNGSGSLRMMDGVIQAFLDRRLSYLERNGHVIWQHNVLLPLDDSYAVGEEIFKPNRNYLVYYPKIEGISNASVSRKVNEKLRQLSNVKAVSANAQLDYTYDGDYDVASFMNPLLVMELNGYKYPLGAAHGMPTRQYVHINLINGHFYALKDLFKPGVDYTKPLNAIIAKQIKEDPQYNYVFEGAFKGIKPDQPFYVTQDALHIYFEPYEIAPFAAGFPTFTIPFSEIMDIINTDGEFWKSFHA